MSLDGTFNALRQRILFVEAVEERLGEALDDFVNSPRGRDFIWDDEHSFSKPGVSHLRLQSRLKPEETDHRLTLDVEVRAHDEVEIITTDWQKIDGRYSGDPETVTLAISPDQGADVATARIISAIMNSGWSEINHSLQKHIESKLQGNGGLSASFDPEPTG